jgi:periplasmic protein CpxP/Spy
MTTRFKTTLAAGIAVVALAAGAPMLMASASAEKATVDKQEQQPRRQGPGLGGPPPGGRGGPGMRGPGRPGAGPMGIGLGFRGLDLTDDQRAQIKSINDSHREQFQQAGEKVRAARQAMQALIESDSIDESAIRSKSAEIASAEADAMILSAKVRQESMQVLTSEQLAKLKEMRTARQAQMKQRRPGRQE